MSGVVLGSGRIDNETDSDGFIVVLTLGLEPKPAPTDVEVVQLPIDGNDGDIKRHSHPLHLPQPATKPSLNSQPAGYEVKMINGAGHKRCRRHIEKIGGWVWVIPEYEVAGGEGRV
jgi:hypothetical protein